MQPHNQAGGQHNFVLTARAYCIADNEVGLIMRAGSLSVLETAISAEPFDEHLRAIFD